MGSIEIEVNSNKNDELWDKVRHHFGEKKIDILEIGVYKAAQIKAAYEKVNVNAYIGVDPYLGNESDPYTGAYWKGELEAFKIYQSSEEIYKQLGGRLIKTTSEIFYRCNEYKYDLIFVDGNHNFFPAFSDLCHWIRRLKPGGIMIVDDYGNSDTPQVTRAVNLFLECFKKDILRVDECITWFKNEHKHIPICDKKIFIFPYEEVKTIIDKEVYIWGTGKYAEAFYQKNNRFVKFKAYLDNYTDREFWHDLPYVSIHSIDKDSSIIVLALNPNNYSEVATQLKESGYIEGSDFIRFDLFEICYLEQWRYK